MILYFVSYYHNSFIIDVVKSHGIPVFGGIVESKVSISEYIKRNLDNINQVDILFIDYSILEDTNDSIVETMKSIRLIYPQMKIIFFASELTQGDELLNDVIEAGIYDIITKNNTTLDDMNYFRQQMQVCLQGKHIEDVQQYIVATEENPKAKRPKLFMSEKKLMLFVGALTLTSFLATSAVTFFVTKNIQCDLDTTRTLLLEKSEKIKQQVDEMKQNNQTVQNNDIEKKELEGMKKQVQQAQATLDQQQQQFLQDKSTYEQDKIKLQQEKVALEQAQKKLEEDKKAYKKKQE